MSPPRSPPQSKHPLVPGALRLAPDLDPDRRPVLAGLITLALAIASDDTAPDGAPAQRATSPHATG